MSKKLSLLRYFQKFIKIPCVQQNFSDYVNIELNEYNKENAKEITIICSTNRTIFERENVQISFASSIRGRYILFIPYMNDFQSYNLFEYIRIKYGISNFYIEDESTNIYYENVNPLTPTFIKNNNAYYPKKL